MSSGNTPKMKKGSRVGEVFLQPNQFSVAMDMLKQADVMLRIGMCVFSGFLFWLINAGWEWPFAFHEGQVPERAIVARVPFTVFNATETEKAREARRRQVITLYRHNQGLVNQLRLQLIEEVIQLKNADSLEALLADKDKADLWNDFMFGLQPVSQPTTTDQQPAPRSADDDVAAARQSETTAKQQSAPKTASPPPLAAAYFAEFKAELEKDEDLTKFKQYLETSMKHIDENGVFEGLQHEFDKDGGDLSQIRVIVNEGEAAKFVQVDDVRIENSLKKLKSNLEDTMPVPLARHVSAWFSVKDRLKETLAFDRTATEALADQEARAVPDEVDVYDVGTTLAPGGQPLTAEIIELLRKEHDEMSRRMTVHQKLALTLSHYGMYATIFSLCGFYSIFRRREVLTDKVSLVRVLCLAVAALIACRFAGIKFAETSLIPLLLFSMTIAVAFDQEVALLLSTVMALIVVVTSGSGMSEFLVYVASMATAVLCLRHVRSRTKLIYVGLITALIAAATSIGASTLMRLDQGLAIIITAAWYGFFAIVAGMLMTALLPLIESLFDIQTELSLLELSDVSHPLLQELVRRAPGTYHHTMNVASIARSGSRYDWCQWSVGACRSLFPRHWQDV